MSKTDKSIKKATFTKESGAASPVLRVKIGESEADFIGRMKAQGWGPLEEKDYTWADDRKSIRAGKSDSLTPSSKDQGKSTDEKTPSSIEVEAPDKISEDQVKAIEEDKKKEET